MTTREAVTTELCDHESEVYGTVTPLGVNQKERFSQKQNCSPINWSNECIQRLCSYMDGPRDVHTKRSESDQERQVSCDITYMWNLKYDTNELIHETETDSHREQTCGCQGGREWGKDGVRVLD